MASAQDIAAGQAVYSPLVLRTYDWFVLGLSNAFLWRCPTADLRRLYDRNVSPCHLDIGVGTGYFLDKACWPVPKPTITLLDLNGNCLSAASRRLERYAPRVVRDNALQPFTALRPGDKPFGSVGLCYLLHCLPGTMARKSVVFDHVRPLLAPGARVFGATIVQGGVHRSRAAQALMNLYNRKGIFSNAEDTVEDLQYALLQRFDSVVVTTRGAVALFEARA